MSTSCTPRVYAARFNVRSRRTTASHARSHTHRAAGVGTGQRASLRRTTSGGSRAITAPFACLRLQRRRLYTLSLLRSGTERFQRRRRDRRDLPGHGSHVDSRRDLTARARPPNVAHRAVSLSSRMPSKSSRASSFHVDGVCVHHSARLQRPSRDAEASSVTLRDTTSSRSSSDRRAQGFPCSMSRLKCLRCDRDDPNGPRRSRIASNETPSVDGMTRVHSQRLKIFDVFVRVRLARSMCRSDDSSHAVPQRPYASCVGPVDRGPEMARDGAHAAHRAALEALFCIAIPSTTRMLPCRTSQRPLRRRPVTFRDHCFALGRAPASSVVACLREAS